MKLDTAKEFARTGSAAFGWEAFGIAIALGLLLAFLPLVQATAMLAPLVAAIVFIEPLVGVGLMLIAAPLGALENVALGGGILDSGQMLFLVTVGAWLAHGAVRRRIVLPGSDFLPPLLVFIAFAALTLLNAVSLLSGFVELFKWIEVGTVALVVVDRAGYLSSKLSGNPVHSLLANGGWRLLLLIILLGAVSQALIGIWQFGLRHSGPEHFQIAGGRFFRAYGTFEQPNPYGGFMAWMAALGIGASTGEVMRWLKTRTMGRGQLAWLLLLLVLSATISLALIFSWSRGAWLGFICGLAVFLLLWPGNHKTGALLLCAAILLIVVVWQANYLPPVVAERVIGFTQDLRFGDVRGADINDANYSVLERLAHWQAALDMAKYNLWTGVGFGNYEAAYADYALINWPYPLGHAHNYYLNILAETGVPGLLAYLIFWLAVLWQTLVIIHHNDWPQRGAALGLLWAWVALSAHHLLDKLYVNNLYLYLGAMLGVLQVLKDQTCRKV